MPVSGEVMFSDEWMNRNAAGKIPAMFCRICRDICKEHGLGNDRDLEMVWLTIKPEMKKVLAYAYGCGVQDTEKDIFMKDEDLKWLALVAAEEFINPPWLEYGN